MKTNTYTGYISLKDKHGIEYYVCKLTHISNEDGTYKYIFKPNYSVIDLLTVDLFQGIPGLNLDLRKEEYIRENMVPCFISERVPQPNRVDLYELLEEVNMEYMIPLEYLKRTNKQYFGDNFYMVDYREPLKINVDMIHHKDNTYNIIKNIIQTIAHNDILSINDELINVSSYRDIFNIDKFILDKMYQTRITKQQEGIAVAKKEKKYKGRKPINISKDEFFFAYNFVKKGTWKASDAIKYLKISRDKYYRLRNSYLKSGELS